MSPLHVCVIRKTKLFPKKSTFTIDHGISGFVGDCIPDKMDKDIQDFCSGEKTSVTPIALKIDDKSFKRKEGFDYLFFFYLLPQKATHKRINGNLSFNTPDGPKCKEILLKFVSAFNS